MKAEAPDSVQTVPLTPATASTASPLATSTDSPAKDHRTKESPPLKPALQPSSPGALTPVIPLKPSQPVYESTAPSQTNPNPNPGPISRTWAVPPRPKPGRKPGQTNNDDSRRASNREAQKKFRSRQADKIQDLTLENDQLRARLQQAQSDAENLRVQLQAAHQSAMAAQSESLGLKRKLDEMQENLERGAKRMRIDPMDQRSQLPSTILPPPTSTALTGAPTPPEDLEIDFTNFGRSGGHHMSDNCGFCEGTDYCMCKEGMKPTDSITLPIVDPPPATTTQPGTCEQCQRDPEQARKCRDLAAAAQHTPEPSSTGITATLPSFAEFERTSCSDFLRQVRPSQHDQRWRTILKRLHTYPHTSKPGQSGRPALDLNANEAAIALAALSKAPRPGSSGS